MKLTELPDGDHSTWVALSQVTSVAQYHDTGLTVLTVLGSTHPITTTLSVAGVVNLIERETVSEDLSRLSKRD